MSDVYKVIDKDATELKQQLKEGKGTFKAYEKVEWDEDLDGAWGSMR